MTLRTLHVLVVDDSERDAELILAALRQSGFNPIHEQVNTADGMKKALQAGPWDVVLSDSSMPYFSGSAALKILREMQPETPFILVSGAIGEEAAVSIMKDGAVDYLLKDRLNRLGSAVERAIQERLLRDQSRRAEQVIQKQAALLEQSHGAISAQDMQGRLLYWNRAATELYGWRREEVVDQEAAKLLYSSCLTQYQEIRQRVIELGQWSGEMTLVNRDGESLAVRSRWFLTRNSAGTPDAIFVVDQDVTEQKKIEASFLRTQRLENIGQLAGGIAHDLNNILSPIMMGLPLLREDLSSESSRNILDGLLASVKRGANIVKQVLMFARGTTGEKTPVQFRYLIKEMAKIMYETFPKPVSIHTDVPGDLWVVMGDSTQFHQVLLNLCVNARDAMPEGGNLILSARNKTLDEKQARQHPHAHAGDYVELSVKDTGGGIAAEHLERIFEPFFTTKGENGTGLGLSTVMGIVKSHQGFVEVESVPGIGTQFLIYLPAVKATVDEITAAGFRPTLQGHGEVILCVDDEESIRNVLRKLLEKNGYRVLMANHGVGALGLYEANRAEIELVLTDLQMPLKDGWQAIAEIRQLDPMLPIIAMSGCVNPEISNRAEDFGVTTVIEKPQGILDVLRIIQQILHEPTQSIQPDASGEAANPDLAA